MKLNRVILALTLLGGMAGMAYVAQLAEPAGSKMSAAADKFLASLSEEQKKKATFAFDDKERTNWHFVPLQDKSKKSTRKGVPLEDMKADQKEAALALVKAGTSMSGYDKAVTIMSLEAILRDLEKGKAMVRNPDWYFFTVFGTPSKTGKWGWRVEGHHLSLNFTVDQGKVISATPSFFGANPATVKDGPKKGLRTLAEAEDLAKQLFKSLNADQRKIAFKEGQFPEIEQAKTAPNVGEPIGLPGAKMTEEQKGILLKLLQSYTARMPEDVGAAEFTQVKEGGLDKVYFGFAGGVEEGKPHTYRVHGPTFLVEFLNMQADSAGNPANHIHSAWRNLRGDFGLTK